MKNREVETWHILIFMLIAAWMIYMIYDRPQITYDNIRTNCQDDSLRMVIGDLRGTLETEEDGWDSKERRYEEILFEYEYGINHLKNSHPSAYKEFHRIIGYKEMYTKETERENIKRLNKYK